MKRACAWCSATRALIRTTNDWAASADQQPIWMCIERAACRRRMTEQTTQQLTGARP